VSVTSLLANRPLGGASHFGTKDRKITSAHVGGGDISNQAGARPMKAQKKPQVQLTCQADAQEYSAKFAQRVRQERKIQKRSLEELAELTKIGVGRLEQLETGGSIFKVAEVQLLGVVLGIGFDEVFPLPNFSQEKIHEIFVSMQENGFGLIAATDGEGSGGRPINQEAFERSVVHLSYCAECLSQFRK
jgi:transcriptional regulator with XRE-family HTH domain